MKTFLKQNRSKLLYLLTASLLFSFSFSLHVSADEFVNGYFRDNGTYVNSYWRSSPDGNPLNNFNFPGNYDPYTGNIAGGNADTYLSNYYNKGADYSPSNYFNNFYDNPSYSPTYDTTYNSSDNNYDSSSYTPSYDDTSGNFYDSSTYSPSSPIQDTWGSSYDDSIYTPTYDTSDPSNNSSSGESAY